MKKHSTLRIGGVPEHFNLPWHLAIDSGALDHALAADHMEVVWQDFPAGTGSMVEALNAGSVDVAMLLTEGAVKAVEQGGDFEIISFYTQSPLIWGVHVPADSDLHSLADLEKADFAISRYGSGSHLMAYLLADQQGWDAEQLSFTLIEDLDGARELFKQGGQHAFLWESFMTQPLVDNKEFRRIAELPTPWPCFVVCVRPFFMHEHTALIKNLLSTVFDTAQEFKASPIAGKLIASRYGLKIGAADQWLTLTQWSKTVDLDPSVLARVRSVLKTLNLI